MTRYSLNQLMFVFALFVQSKLEKVFWLFIENESELNSKKNQKQKLELDSV